MLFIPDWDYDTDDVVTKAGVIAVDAKGTIYTRLCGGWIANAPEAIIFAEAPDGVMAFDTVGDFTKWLIDREAP